MNIEQLRAAYRAACEAVQAASAALLEPAESADMSALRTSFDDAEAEALRVKGLLETAARAEAAQATFTVPTAEEITMSERTPATSRAQEPGVSVGGEPLVYSRHSERSFFADMHSRQLDGDAGAAERLARHSRQMADINPVERRDVGTAALSGLVIPQYLIDLYAPLARAGRPYADSIMRLPLPAEGMTLNISRITTGTTTAIQAAENDASSETDIDDTLLTVNVRTIAGQQDVSRQTIERGAPGNDELIYLDLLGAYNANLDSQILNGAGTSGTHLGVRNVTSVLTATYTDASPTVPEAYPKIADAIQQIATSRFLPADKIFMHPRRWGWFTAALDSSSRPLVVPVANGPYMAEGVAEKPGFGTVVGYLQGLPVVTDASIPTNLGTGTNEDAIIVCRTLDHILWEEGDGTPRRARFEQTIGGNLTIKLVLYGYSAFTAGRYPASSAIIGGTGLVTPTF